MGSGTVKPQPSKMYVVESFGTPKTKTQVSAFLGLTDYYRRFVQFSLTRKLAPGQVEWTSECNRAFCKLKKQLYPMICVVLSF